MARGRPICVQGFRICELVPVNGQGAGPGRVAEPAGTRRRAWLSPCRAGWCVEGRAACCALTLGCWSSLHACHVPCSPRSRHPLPSLLQPPLCRPHYLPLLPAPTLFRRVQGLDATAARTFVTLHTKLHRMGIQLIITHLPTSRPSIQKLLVAQGLILMRPSEAAAGAEGGGGGEDGAAGSSSERGEGGLERGKEGRNIGNAQTGGERQCTERARVLQEGSFIGWEGWLAGIKSSSITSMGLAGSFQLGARGKHSRAAGQSCHSQVDSGVMMSHAGMQQS